MVSDVFFAHTSMPSGPAATTTSLSPSQKIGAPNSLITWVLLFFLPNMALPIMLDGNSSVRVFHVPRSFQLPLNGTAATL